MNEKQEIEPQAEKEEGWKSIGEGVWHSPDREG